MLLRDVGPVQTDLADVHGSFPVVRATLEAEILVLRQQINVLRRGAPRKLAFNPIDRLIFIGLYRLFAQTCRALAIVKPDTVIRWHRAGFRSYWRWKSRRRCGRPSVPLEIRKLIRDMSLANQLSLSETLCSWRRVANRVMLMPNGRSFHPVVVSAHQLV